MKTNPKNVIRDCMLFGGRLRVVTINPKFNSVVRNNTNTIASVNELNGQGHKNEVEEQG